MDPCFSCFLILPSECLSRNWDSSDKATFCQSSLVQFWPACMNCPCSFLAPSVVFCCYSPFLSRLDSLCIWRYSSAYLGCNECLFELLLSYYQLILVWSFSSDIWYQWDIFALRNTAYWVFSLFRRFSVNHMQENRSPLSEIVRLAHLAPITIESRLNHSLHDTRQGSQLLGAPCHLGDPKGWQTLNFCLNLMTNRSRMC